MRLWCAALARFTPRFALARLEATDPLYSRAGERLVERALRRRGWRFLARRLKTQQGEIDLLFVERETLVVVEVKTGRAGARFHPGQRLERSQLERLWRAARGLARHAPHRVDLVEVLLVPDGLVSLAYWPCIREPLP